MTNVLLKRLIVRCYHDEKMTQKEIYKLVGICPAVQTKILKEYNISINPRKRRYHFNESIFDNIDSPEKAYWIGFIFGDGSVNKFSLRIELNNTDRPHLLKFLKFMNADDNKITSAVKNCSFIYINSAKFVRTLSNYNIIPNKTKYVDKLPYINDSLYRFFVLGLIDSDGWISKHIRTDTGRHQYEIGFSSSHVSIVKEIKSWFSKQLNKEVGYISARDGKCPQVIIGGNNNFVHMYELLYNGHDIGLERKRTKATLAMEFILSQQSC